MEGRKKIQSFEDLIAWKEGHSLALEIYSITKKFPNEEIFGLSNQMRRAAVSITSNIAEGFSRDTLKDKSHFYTMSKGSLTELQSQLCVARDVKYLSSSEFEEVSKKMVIVGKLITGLQKSTKNHFS